MKTVRLECRALYPVEAPGLNRTVEPGEVFELPEDIVEEFGLLSKTSQFKKSKRKIGKEEIKEVEEEEIKEVKQ